MRKIITTTFVTLDGVMQAPGGPQEDESGAFAYGGWAIGTNPWDDVMGRTMHGIMGQPFELLLGRRTYEIFAAYWPTATVDQEVAVPFNRTVKHVVSREPIELTWHNSQLITGDVVPRLEQLKAQEGPDLWVHGSGNLIQTLLAHDLVDRMLLWTFPVTVGDGKKLFAAGSQLLDRALTFCRGRAFSRVFLWTFAGLDHARRLYGAAGFVITEQRVGTRWGTEVLEQRLELGL